MKRIGFLLALIGSAIISSPAASLAGSDAPSLRQNANQNLQHQLERKIERLHLSGAVRQNRLSVALVDVTNPEHPKMAAVNGDSMVYAASLPKIAILLAAFERIHEGKLKLNDENRELMTQMIRYSNNHAATAMIRKVGREYINQVLTSPKYRLYDSRYNGGLWVGKEYASGTAFHRDPLHHLSHGATAIQVARFYYMLETGQLVTPKLSAEMKSILSKPGIRHKFVKGLMADYPNVEMYRKSGSWRTYHADSALIEHNGHRYIAVALAQDPKGGEWMTRLIHEMDAIILASHPTTDLAAASTSSRNPS